MSEPATSIVWVLCPKCDAQLPCQDPADSRYFGCHRCSTFFHFNPTSTASVAKRLDGFRKPIEPGPSLPLGAVAVLGGHRCRLTGYQVRSEKQDRTVEWREYQLRPAEPLGAAEPTDFPLQLAEYQGHWLLIRRATCFPEVRNNQLFKQTNWYDVTTDRHYQLWHRYQPVIRDAVGEFDWNILEDEELHIREFTAPPYLLTSEHRSSQRPVWYLAEYLEAQQIQAAFGLAPATLPERIGIGAAQPAPVPGWPQLRQLAVATLGLLGLLQALVLVRHQPMALPQADFVVAAAGPAATNQLLTSKSFTLPQTTALNVTLAAPSLTNHWVEVTASLVDEQTGRGYEFTRSLEYYQGVEDGESWSEGNNSTDAVLSGIPAGRYHVNLYPTLDPGAGSTELRLDIETDTPLWSNFFVVLGVLVLVPVVSIWRRRSFEQARWENSDFSPYSGSYFDA
jgi:hypothetical protein